MEVLILDKDDRRILWRTDTARKLASPIQVDDTSGRHFSRCFLLILLRLKSNRRVLQ